MNSERLVIVDGVRTPFARWAPIFAPGAEGLDASPSTRFSPDRPDPVVDEVILAALRNLGRGQRRARHRVARWSAGTCPAQRSIQAPPAAKRSAGHEKRSPVRVHLHRRRR